jgi:hypothetical protein
MRRAIEHLESFGYLKVLHWAARNKPNALIMRVTASMLLATCTKRQTGRSSGRSSVAHPVAHSVAHREMALAGKSMACGGNTVDSGITVNTEIIPIPTESDRVAAQRGSRVDLERFAALCDLITNDYGKIDRDGYTYQTMGGIVYISSGETVGGTPYDDCFDPSEISEWERAGLLIRKGQRIYISQLGCDAVERYKMAA